MIFGRRIALISLLPLAACHTPLIPKTEAIRVAKTVSIELQEPVAIQAEYSFGRKLTFSVKAGKLISAFEGPAGVFYSTAEDGVAMHIDGKLSTTYDGGIWISNSIPKKVRIYAHEGTVSEYDAEGRKFRTSKNPSNTNYDTPVATSTKPPTGSQLLGAAIGYTIVDYLAQLDPERIMFLTEAVPLNQEIGTPKDF